MIDEKFVFLGLALSMTGSFIYVREVLKGNVKPNRMTWILWAFAPMIAFSAQISEGAGLRSVQTFSAGFGPLLVVIASFYNKKSYWKLNKIDYVFGVFSVLGLVLWYITGEGLLAILFAILADLFAAIPTIQKIYKHPETESSAVFGLGIVSSLLTLLTIKVWRPEEYAFSLYVLLVCAVMFYPTAKIWAGLARERFA